MAFNAKNLTYDRNEPAFLRRLKGEFGDGVGVRRDRPDARPTTSRYAYEDDGPTYVVEEISENISKDEYEKLLEAQDQDKCLPETNGKDGDKRQADDYLPPDDAAEGASSSSKNRGSNTVQKLADIGRLKKRKHVIVVGDLDPSGKSEQPPQKVQTSSRPKQTKKKEIKLSFDEEEC